MTRRWMHCGCIAAAAVACLITLSAAAPILKDESVAAAEKPLVRTKRADEIIFNGQQEVDGVRIKKSDESAAGNDVHAKTDDVSKSSTEDESAQKETESKSDGADSKEANENGGLEDLSETDEASEVNGIDKSTRDNNDDDERAGGRVWDDEADYIGETELRRRRRAATAASGSTENRQRQERSVAQPAVAMVAENMAVPMASAVGGGARLQRAKRELDADEIRELLDSREQALAPYGNERAALDYNDYGPSADEQQEETAVNGAGSEEEPYEEDGGDYVGGDSANYFTSDDRRPKRRGDDDEVDEEEAYEEAERQVVRELLAERAAEETRQALLAYLSSSEESERGREPYGGGAVYRPDETFGESDADDEETGYADDEDDEVQPDDDDDFEEVSREAEPEEIDENDDRLSTSQFLGGDAPETVDGAAEQKRFSYPYSYEPYGGRWGALVPGAKRSDRDPYDRLYRLAEALSRPSIGDEDEKK